MSNVTVTPNPQHHPWYYIYLHPGAYWAKVKQGFSPSTGKKDFEQGARATNLTAADPAGIAGKIGNALGNGDDWVRGGEILAGALLLAIGINALTKGSAGKVAKGALVA
jgi:hypothetical protein